jgi:uncharacterized protein
MVDSGSARPLALVTGASAGIGAEIAMELARRGHDIVATGRSETLHEVASQLRELGADVHEVRADLSSYDGVEGLWQQASALGRPLDVAVLNAGFSIGGAFVDTDLAEELRLIAVNVNAVVHLAKRVLPPMLERGRGRVLVTSSISATKPTPYETVYGPSKAFEFSFAQALREELRGTGVTVTALLPGATDSDFHARAGMGATVIGRSKKNDRHLVARQGVDAMLLGKDHVIGGDRATRRQALLNRFLPETVKARRHAGRARPPSPASGQADGARVPGWPHE